MAAENTLNHSLGRAQEHYRSLFSLPSLHAALAGVAFLCLATGILSAVFVQTWQGLANGVLLGVILFAASFAGDMMVSRLVLRDPIFVLRRTIGLSLVSWLVWFLLILIGTGLGMALGIGFWVKLCLLGFATVLTLRTVVLTVVSSASVSRSFCAILLQPVACILPLVAFGASLNVTLKEFLPFIFVSPFIALGFAYVFMRLLALEGQKEHGIPVIDIFRAFLLDWVTAHNAPLESYLERMGENADVEVSLLKFDSDKPKAVFIVPQVHPGPFKNIGSSLLPSLLKEEYERNLGGNACVPLGLLGHELDAASQAQNHKIISHVIAATRIPSSLEDASPFVRVVKGFVAASCQLFGKIALLSFTLAPKTTEDLPVELGNIVSLEAANLGLDAVLVNAHNSLTENPLVEAPLDTLKGVALQCLQNAVALRPGRFSVGSATVHPAELSLRDGMGTGGITVITIKVEEQKTAYVVIDGNNMVSGLRERIQQALSKVGFEESEVYTTDTHAVSAVAVGRRGYHPVGETMNQTILIDRIVECAQKAANTMEPSKAAYKKIEVKGVRVIGGGFLNSITGLVDQTIQKAKRIVTPVFAAEGALLILLLLVF